MSTTGSMNFVVRAVAGVQVGDQPLADLHHVAGALLEVGGARTRRTA